MQIETYEIEQSTSEASDMAKDAEALELIEKLGLTGQKRIIDPKTATRNPYRVMEKQELHIYQALLTKHSKVEAYDADAIPLRVLQVAAHAKQCEMFDGVEVWYSEPAVLRDDPILVGIVKKKNDWGGTDNVFHILARWGKSLLPIEQLEAMAVDMLRRQRISNLRDIINKATSRLNLVKETSDLETLASAPSYCD